VRAYSLGGPGAASQQGERGKGPAPRLLVQLPLTTGLDRAKGMSQWRVCHDERERLAMRVPGARRALLRCGASVGRRWRHNKAES
jgi:hypothetical protein